MEEKRSSGISFTELLEYYKSKILIIILTVVVFILGSLVVTKFLIKPKYTATSSIYVINKSNDNNLGTSDMQLSQEILNDYKVLISSKNVVKDVIRELDLDMTPGALASEIHVSSTKGTRVLEINIEDTDPERAAQIANTVWVVAAKHLKAIMDVEAVNLVYEADVPKSPSSPNLMMNLVISALIGLVGVIVVLTFICVFDDRIKKRDDVKLQLGLNTLAIIPYSKEMDEDLQKKLKLKFNKQENENVEKLGEDK